MGESDTTKLFSEIPDDKRLGILRTFHHKMYEKDELSSQEKAVHLCTRFTSYYCVENKGACLVILISFALVFVGAFSIGYGYMMPNLYKFLDKLESNEEKVKDTIEYTKYKDVFIISGIAMIGFGVICASAGFFFPVYRDTNKDSDNESECEKTPIIVDYELPPYETSLEAGNYFYEDTTSGPESLCSEQSSYCESPIENDNFKTFFIQSDSQP